MADPQKNGRVHLGTVLLVLGVIGGPLAVWGDAQRKDGQVSEKLSTLEKRQQEDRSDTRQNINEVKQHVQQIDKATQEILQTIRAMEAVQKAERRRESR
jgi:uncharacterized protein HemX